MASAVATLPLRTSFGALSLKPKDSAPPHECTVTCGFSKWSISSSLICDASPFLHHLLNSNTKNESLNLEYLANFNPVASSAIRAVIEFIRSSEIVLEPGLLGSQASAAQKLQHCAEIYVLANVLQMPILKTRILETWTEIMNTCLFGRLTVLEVKSLVQYTFVNTMRTDSGLRSAVIKLAAFYHQKYLSMYDSILTDKKIQKICSPQLYKVLFLYRSQFPELETLLNSEEPQAWELVKAYEEQRQNLEVLYGP